jgi:hypothetical protein
MSELHVGNGGSNPPGGVIKPLEYSFRPLQSSLAEDAIKDRSRFPVIGKSPSKVTPTLRETGFESSWWLMVAEKSSFIFIAASFKTSTERGKLEVRAKLLVIIYKASHRKC